MTITPKRAERVSLASLILSILFFVVCLLTGRWSGFISISALGWLGLASVLIWLVLWIQFHTRGLADQEKLDLSELSRSKDSQTIFQGRKEEKLFAVAARRLEVYEKWFVPIFAAVVGLYEVGISLYQLKNVQTSTSFETQQPLICAVVMTGIAFVSFLLSRFATGMSNQRQWRPLRAGGSILLCLAILSFAAAIGLALAQFKLFAVVSVLNWTIPIIMLVVGAETCLNVVFDIYRPRLKDQYGKSGFDSRLLGIINEPGGFFHTVAGAIDYQFGFKVSQTWFYKLLEKAILPLSIIAALILYFMSCFYVVGPNEEAMVEHFGKPAEEVVGSGLHFKMPWPIEICYKYPTQKIMEINIGFEPKEYEEGQRREALLWKMSHHEEEELLLFASESASGEEGAASVSLLVAAVPVHYRIKDLRSFVYNHKDPEKVFESICYGQLCRLAASSRIEVGNAEELNQSLLGAGRVQARKTLTERIQKAVDDAGLGVEVVFLGLQGIHPPEQVAGDYQAVVGALQEKQAIILNAQAERNIILGSLAGSVEEAERLFELAAEYQLAREKNDTEKLNEISNEIDKAFAEAKGDIFSTLKNAQSYRFEKSKLAEATGKRFIDQHKAFKAAPEIYMKEQRLLALEEGLEKIRKYIVVSDANDNQIFIIDVKEQLTPDLFDLSGFEENI